jgi:hypothetical protein
VHFGLEGRLNLLDATAELDETLARRNLLYHESLLLQPVRNLGDVGIGDAKVRAELFGRHPLVEVGMFFVELLIEQGAERMFLIRRSAQNHDQVVHGGLAGQPPEVLGVAQNWHSVPRESDTLSIVDPGLHAGDWERVAAGLRLCGLHEPWRNQ